MATHPEVHYAEQLVLASAMRWARSTDSDLTDAIDRLTRDVARLRTAYHRQLTEAGLGASPLLDLLIDIEAKIETAVMTEDQDKPHVVVQIDPDPCTWTTTRSGRVPVPVCHGPYPDQATALAAAVTASEELNRGNDGDVPFVAVPVRMFPAHQ